MNENFFSLVQECSNKYSIKEINENEIEISIRIPKKFKILWLSKLSDLKASQEEIEFYIDENGTEM